MGLLTWIIFGALAGWLASIITRTNREMGALLNIIVGIAGAIIGGSVAGLIGIDGVGEFNLSSLIVAVLGAVVLISIVKAFDRQPNH